MDPGSPHSHQEAYGQSFYQKPSVVPQVSSVYSYNSNVVTGSPNQESTERFLRYVPNKTPLSSGQVNIDVSDGGIHDKDVRGLDKARGGMFSDMANFNMTLISL